MGSTGMLLVTNASNGGCNNPHTHAGDLRLPLGLSKSGAGCCCRAPPDSHVVALCGWLDGGYPWPVERHEGYHHRRDRIPPPQTDEQSRRVFTRGGWQLAHGGTRVYRVPWLAAGVTLSIRATATPPTSLRVGRWALCVQRQRGDTSEWGLGHGVSRRLLMQLTLPLTWL